MKQVSDDGCYCSLLVMLSIMYQSFQPSPVSPLFRSSECTHCCIACSKQVISCSKKQFCLFGKTIVPVGNKRCIDHYLLQLNPTLYKSSYFNLPLLQYCNAVVGVETEMQALHLPAIDAVYYEQNLRLILLSKNLQFLYFVFPTVMKMVK